MDAPCVLSQTRQACFAGCAMRALTGNSLPSPSILNHNAAWGRGCHRCDRRTKRPAIAGCNRPEVAGQMPHEDSGSEKDRRREPIDNGTGASASKATAYKQHRTRPRRVGVWRVALVAEADEHTI